MMTTNKYSIFIHKKPIIFNIFVVSDKGRRRYRANNYPVKQPMYARLFTKLISVVR